LREVALYVLTFLLKVRLVRNLGVRARKSAAAGGPAACVEGGFTVVAFVKHQGDVLAGLGQMAIRGSQFLKKTLGPCNWGG